jgi:hypothetical protein
MMMVMPSNHSSIATCLLQKPMGNGITDHRRKKHSRKHMYLKLFTHMYVCKYVCT